MSLSSFLKEDIENCEWSLRACLHGGGGPQVGEVTGLGGVTKVASVVCQSG